MPESKKVQKNARIMPEKGTFDLRTEGRRIFMCELAKRITVPVSLDFMSVSSYGDDTKSSGVVKIVKDLGPAAGSGKDVLIVEDIIDSGRTLSYF